MSDEPRVDESASPPDVGAYCRAVERHLTAVNGGHLVRIVGPGFQLVERWAHEGVPLTVVFRAIESKADRHRAGASSRPLRIEFCEDDVREGYEDWRRAIGVSAPASVADEPEPDREDAGRRPALGAQLERAIVRLTRVSGRLDFPDALREGVATTLAEITALKETSRGARGATRARAAAALAEIDARLRVRVRETAPSALLSDARQNAERDLAPYRDRMAHEVWQRAIEESIDRLMRDRLGLPVLDF